MQFRPSVYQTLGQLVQLKAGWRDGVITKQNQIGHSCGLCAETIVAIGGGRGERMCVHMLEQRAARRDK